MILGDIEKRVEGMISSNLYDVVSLTDVKRATEFELSKNNREYIEYTLNDYKEYLKLIDSLPEKMRQSFLETLKRNEIKHTQKAENQDTFLLEFYRTMEKSNSIDMGVELLNDKKILLPGDIELLHDKLLEGTEEENAKGYRKKDDKIVGGIKNGVEDVHFIPIRKEEIPEAMRLITEFINSESTPEEIFTKPFIAHGLIAIVQAFPDGNTRLARLVQQLKIWELTQKHGLSYINLPALYMSKSYLMMRGNYRNYQRRIVTDKDDAAWNKWIEFNLDAVNEQLTFGTSNLEKIRRTF